MNVRVPALVVCLLGFGLSACGGGSVPRVPFAAPAPEARAPHGSTIGGVINTTAFTIPAGAPVTVTKNLVVFASKSVTIPGTLIVPVGISVAFYTPSFTLQAYNGAFGFIETESNGKYNGPVNDIVSACQVNVEPGTIWDIGGGDNLAITADAKSSGKHACSFTLPAAVHGGTVLSMATGAEGGSYSHRYIGINGGWIEIGSKQAITVTEALAKKNGHPTVQAFAPGVVTLDSPLNAGNGGGGYPDQTGLSSFSGDTYTAYAGGIGGSVEITAGKIAGSAVQIRAGNGGNGGTVGPTVVYDYDVLGPLDGTPSAPNALGLVLNMGSGGGGGGIFISAKTPKNIKEEAGNGGNASPVTGAYGGRGCCQYGVGGTYPLTGTGNGGNLTVNLAGPGLKGPNGNNRPSKAQNGAMGTITVSGGYGSSFISAMAMPGAQAQGGKGGDLTFVPPPHFTIASLAQFGLSIVVGEYGNGGMSQSRCLQYPPSAPGLQGGAAGTLYDNGLIDYIAPPAPNGWGFDGGSGGDGTPPGAGGAAGGTAEGTTLGVVGNAGLVC